MADVPPTVADVPPTVADVTPTAADAPSAVTEIPPMVVDMPPAVESAPPTSPLALPVPDVTRMVKPTENSTARLQAPNEISRSGRSSDVLQHDGDNESSETSGQQLRRSNRIRRPNPKYKDYI